MRFAMIGSNFIVDSFVNAARLCEGVSLAAVYSRTEAQARQNAEKWGIPKAVWDIRQLAADPDIDAVYIASPNLFHFEQAELFLRAGKHVLCEKPIVPYEGQLPTLLRIAQERGVLLLEAIRPAFLPAVDTVRALLPKLGTLRFAEFAYAQYSRRYDRYQAGIVENAFDPTLCNGTLIDLGVYCVAWMLLLFGMPDKIAALASALDGSIDTNGAALCQFGTMQICLRYSKVHQSERHCVLEGENGYMQLTPFPIPTQAHVHLRGEPVETVDLGTLPDDMRYEIDSFVKMAADPPTAKQHQRGSLLTLRVMDMIRAQTGIHFEKEPADAHRSEGVRAAF